MLTKERLSERKRGIGGSDIGSILGVNPFKSKRDLALEKLNMVPEQEVTPAMERGTRLEPIVAEIFTEKTGIEVREEKQVIVHPKHEFMLGNIDRYTYPDLAVLEIKCPGLGIFSKIRREGLPMAWAAQLQWYLSILGEENGIFAVFNSELWKLEHYHVKADPEFQELMIAEAEKFWTDLQNGIIPEDGGLVIDLPSTGNSDVLKVNSSEWADALRELEEADEILKEAEELKNNAKETIRTLMGVFDIAEGQGYRVYNTFQNGRTSIDSKKLKKEFPDVYAKCAKSGQPFRTFRTFKIKGE